MSDEPLRACQSCFALLLLTESLCVFATVIQRLGGDGLLIGSRRRVGAAPVVVSGVGGVVGEVTTTVAIGDGAVELGSALVWTEALLAWTAQVRRHTYSLSPRSNRTARLTYAAVLCVV